MRWDRPQQAGSLVTAQQEDWRKKEGAALQVILPGAFTGSEPPVSACKQGEAGEPREQAGPGEPGPLQEHPVLPLRHSTLHRPVSAATGQRCVFLPKART